MGAGAAAAGISAAATIGSAAIGASKGSSGSGSSGTQSTSNLPWSAQQPYLTDGFADAKNIYDARSASTLPSSYFAGTNGMQTAATQGLYNQGINSAGMMQNVAASAAPLMDGTANTYANNATNISQNGIGARNSDVGAVLSNYALTGQMPGQTGADPALTDSLTSAAMGSVGSLGQSQAISNRVAANASDPSAAMRSTVSGAGSYINNDVLNGQIDAVGTDISRNLGENTLYGIRQGAQTSGNVNSSREGALEAIGTRGAQENLANAAATIRGNAYNTGATIASGQYQNAQTNAQAAANALNTTGTAAGSIGTNQAALQQQQGQFGVTSQLGAATTSGNQDLAWQQADTSARLAGNAQLGTGLQIGAANTATGSQGALSALQASQAAGTYQQAQDQSAINNANAIWSAGDTRQQSLLNDYWAIVGKPVGTQSTGTSTQTTQGSGALAGALGGLTTGYGVAKNLTGVDDPFGIKGSLSGSGSNYDPAKTGWGTDGSSTSQASNPFMFYTPLS